MTTTRRRTVEEMMERRLLLRRHDDPFIPLAAAIIAVLASLGTLFSHHRSISALSTKNEAIILQAKATDQYNYYETKRIRYTVYSALATGSARDAAARKSLESTADREQTSSIPVLTKAQGLERQATEEQQRSEVILKSFETLEIATTLFEISIVLVSLSALTSTRLMLYLGSGVSAIGLVFLVIGLLQPH